jgi:hypothetical protein
MSHYKQPSSFNPVSLVLLLALGGAVYAGVKFAPPYWRDRQVKTLVDEAANRFYRERSNPGIEATLRTDLTAQIRALGIDDPDLVVSVERAASKLRVAVSYTVVVSHPGNKITTLRFSPTTETDTQSPFD